MNRLEVIRRATLALVLCGFPAAALAQDPAETGRALVQEHCASCHAIGKTGDSPKTGAPPFRTLGRSYDLDQFSRQLRRGVLSGHPDMPVIKFKPADARAVGVFLRSIQE